SCFLVFSFTELSLVLLWLFFFSSRRRHTRSKRDWSSDVCSSDLAALDALAGQQQVHPDAASDPPDRQEQLDEVGACGEQFAELVDDHQQMPQRGQARVLFALVLVVADVGHVTRVPHHLLPALALT